MPYTNRTSSVTTGNSVDMGSVGKAAEVAIFQVMCEHEACQISMHAEAQDTKSEHTCQTGHKLHTCH